MRRTGFLTNACPLDPHRRLGLRSPLLGGHPLARPMWMRKATSYPLRWPSVPRASCLARLMHHEWKEQMVNSLTGDLHPSRRSNVGPKMLPMVGGRTVRTPPMQRGNWFHRNQKQRFLPAVDGHLVVAIHVLQLVQRTGFRSIPRLDLAFRNPPMEGLSDGAAP